MTLRKPANYTDSNRLGNLTAEAVGVIKGEKHFPVFEERIIFKPLTESALSKLSQMSDEDFEKLELYPDFDA